MLTLSLQRHLPSGLQQSNPVVLGKLASPQS